MGKLREPKINKTKLKKLSKTQDLKEALELMVDLQDNHVFLEEEVTTKYNEKTGKPAESSWKPYKKFDANFTYGGESYEGEVRIHLTNEVINEIKKGPVCFNINNKTYIAKFEIKDHSGSDRDGRINCIEHLVYLSEARNL